MTFEEQHSEPAYEPPEAHELRLVIADLVMESSSISDFRDKLIILDAQKGFSGKHFVVDPDRQKKYTIRELIDALGSNDWYGIDHGTPVWLINIMKGRDLR